MISLAAPWALVALLSLPVIVLLHRRRRRAVPVDVPSLLFLEAEKADADAPERVRVDADLLLALAAALLLSLAAIGPRFASAAPGRTVRVVVDAGPAMDAKRGDGTTAKQRAWAAFESIRHAIPNADALEWIFASGGIDSLLRIARAGEAGLRVVVSDRLPRPEPTDVRCVAVGDPDARNVGIVAASVDGDVPATRLFVNVLNGGPGEVEATVEGLLAGPPHVAVPRVIRIPAGVARSVEFERVFDRVRIGAPEAGDLPADDEVTLSRRPLRVAFVEGPAGYAAPYRQAVLSGLRASLGTEGVHETASDPDLVVGPGVSAFRPVGLRWRLLLRPLPEGTEGMRLPRAAAVDFAEPPFGVDLDPTGCDLVFAPHSPLEPKFPLVQVLLPVPEREMVVTFGPDPLAGHPAPVDHPIWPLFLDDLATEILGRGVGGGWHAKGVLDPDATRLGRDVRPFDPAWLEAVPPDRRPRERDPKILLIAAGALCLGLLWVRRAPSARATGTVSG